LSFLLCVLQTAVSLLKRAADRYADNAAVFNCLGEVLGQTGEATGALEAFQKSFRLSPSSPMPFLNAARVYQQLSQSDACETHLKEALRRDNTLVLAYVDCAQLCLQSKGLRSSRAAVTANISDSATAARIVGPRKAQVYLDLALHLCRHISEVADVFASETIALVHMAALGEDQ
jgi:tetratricopeptide (TPR) repeat protein